MDAVISYSRAIPTYKQIIGIGLIVLGVYGLVFVSILNGIVMFIMSFLLLRSDGTEIDLNAKTYRKTMSYLGLKVGKWQALPVSEYISVFSTEEAITVRAISAQTTNTNSIIHLNLFFQGNKKITDYETKTFADAFDVALHIADALLIDLLDATVKGDFKWVDKEELRKTREIIHTA
ncbi:MAG: hypothetical protein HRU26_02705 [Psychroserpens sp.]|nr:hypothetical protein [Psychroserpens sp.]